MTIHQNAKLYPLVASRKIEKKSHHDGFATKLMPRSVSAHNNRIVFTLSSFGSPSYSTKLVRSLFYCMLLSDTTTIPNDDATIQCPCCSAKLSSAYYRSFPNSSRLWSNRVDHRVF